MLPIAPPRNYNDKILIVTVLPIDEPDPPPAVPVPPAAAEEAAAPVEAAPVEAAAAAPARGGRKPARSGGST